MKISKKDALMWFRFFAELPEDEPLMPHQQELAWAVISQIETAVDARHKELMARIGDYPIVFPRSVPAKGHERLTEKSQAFRPGRPGEIFQGMHVLPDRYGTERHPPDEQV